MVADAKSPQTPTKKLPAWDACTKISFSAATHTTNMLKTMIAMEFMAILDNIVPSSPGARQDLLEIKTQVHEAAKSGKILVQEWQILIERSNEVEHVCDNTPKH
ncbi:hypothetical protein [Duganella levis]|uniref:Uncharacterized protein n=1 Tax=Duganella levis TaxID=2692169 RepID=A0ABW9W6F7_9BURK|nr:hypothetical protein [Duganella levis]MYN29195.1 hypothetical protein [Duganella levis]